MWRKSVLFWFAAVVAPQALWAQYPVAPLITEVTANKHGLHRPWFAQIDIDRSKYVVTHVSYHRGVLFLMASSGTVHAVDAETGATLWTGETGAPDEPNVPAAANEEVVVTVTGSRVSVFDRTTGEVRWARRMIGVPSGAAAMGSKLCTLPTETGLMTAYDLADPQKVPARVGTGGRTIVDPLATWAAALFPTTEATLVAIEPDSLAPLFTLETGGVIASKPGYMTPWVFVASLNGYVYAVHERTGVPAWRFSAGEPLRASPIAFDRSINIGGKIEPGDVFTIKLGDQSVSVTATSPSATIVAADLAAAWNDSKAKGFSYLAAVTAVNYDGTVKSLDEGVLTVQGMDRKTHRYPLGPDVVVTLGGRPASQFDIVPGMPIQLRLDGAGRIVALSDVPRSEVAVVSISNMPGSSITYKVELSTVEADKKAADGQLFTLNEDSVYVFPEVSGLHALSAETGQPRWYTPYAGLFVAASPTRLYLDNRRGEMIVLDRASGAVIDGFSLPDSRVHFSNVFTDRIFLVSTTGLVQALYEREFGQPVIYEAPRVVPADVKRKPGEVPAPRGEDAPKPTAAEPAAEEPAGEEDPFAGAAPRAGAAEEQDPFAEDAGEAPAGGAAEEEDPFAAGEDGEAMEAEPEPAEEVDPFAE